MSSMITPKQPYYVKGYTGHCPDMSTRFGSSYGALSHKILLDPLVRHSDKLVLADSEVADFMLNENKTKGKQCHGGMRTETTEESKEEREDLVHQNKYNLPISVSYKGHLPATYDSLGISSVKKAEESIPQFKQTLKRKQDAVREIEKIKDMRYGRRQIKTMEDKELMEDEFSLPLVEVRPEHCGIIRNVFKDEEPKHIHSNIKKLPYFMESLDEGKHFMPGYAGHVPFGYSKFGATFKNSSNNALKEFTYQQNRMKSVEWAPAGTIREEIAAEPEPHTIYSDKHGLIPKYSGFVPGLQFGCGKRYGIMTMNAKKWLKEDN